MVSEKAGFAVVKVPFKRYKTEAEQASLGVLAPLLAYCRAVLRLPLPLVGRQRPDCPLIVGDGAYGCCHVGAFCAQQA